MVSLASRAEIRSITSVSVRAVSIISATTSLYAKSFSSLSLSPLYPCCLSAAALAVAEIRYYGLLRLPNAFSYRRV